MPSSERAGFLRGLARGLVKFYYPRIEVTGGPLIPREGPVLLVANHPNSLIDPVLLGIAAQRPVRLLAKAPLLAMPVLGAALRALGMVPAYRGSDDARQVAKNLESLAAAARQLAQGGVMGIFPEGKSHDVPRLALVRSGAARLAMQALAARATGFGPEVATGSPLARSTGSGQAGGRGLRIVPVGINYERKERFRTAVWIKVGRPIDAERWRRMHGGDEHRAMRTLTQEIDARLRHCVTHLDNLAWEPLLGDLEALLPPAPGGRRPFSRLRAGAALATLHRRKRAADAINHFHRSDSERAAAAAARVAAHAAALRAAGATADARVFTRRGLALAGTMLRDALFIVLAAAVALVGLLHHALPYGVVRVLARRMAGPGRMVVALTRLLLSLPLYAAWYAFVWWRMSLYFLPWVAWTWAALMPVAGLIALATTRWLRVAAQLWWAEARLLADRPRAAALRAEHAAVGRMLEEFATEAKLPTTAAAAAPPGVIYRPPAWATVLAGGVAAALALALGAWLLRDRPIEFLRQDAPALHELSPAPLAERMAADERALLAVLRGLAELEARFHKFEAALARGDRSYYRPEDDDEIRRMLVSYLSFRTALLRTVWQYQRYAEIDDERIRLRALLLHYTAAAMAYDYSARLSAKLLRYKLATAAADVGKFTRGGWYRASSAVSTLIGDTKFREPRRGAALITPERLAALRPRLRPGDIVIERRNWYFSNAFLPGYWPHSALYVGTVADLRALGLDADPRVARHLAAFARPDAAGHPPAFIEAVSEGVVFTTAEHSIGEADSVAVLRARLTPEQIQEVIARAFSHAGKPYDFDFDFFSGDKLVCTELVYRAYGSFIDFPLVEILGRKTLPAVEIVRHWASAAGAPQLEFVAFLDGDDATVTCVERDAAALKASINRPALTWRQ